MTEQQVRRSFVNCSQRAARALTLPENFAALDWTRLELLGWRDPEAPLRGYLVVETRTGDRPVGVAVRAADTRMPSRTTAMCLLCQTAQAGDAAGAYGDPAVAAGPEPGGGGGRAGGRAPRTGAGFRRRGPAVMCG